MKCDHKIAVFGGGSWATAIVKMLSENVDPIGWYMRSVYITEHIKRNRHNPTYLSSVEFDTDQLKLIQRHQRNGGVRRPVNFCYSFRFFKRVS